MARQFALCTRTRKMDYGLPKYAIAVWAGKLENYLKKAKHNVSDDGIARQGGIRY
jgi:hypothetical protein